MSEDTSSGRNGDYNVQGLGNDIYTMAREYVIRCGLRWEVTEGNLDNYEAIARSIVKIVLKDNTRDFILIHEKEMQYKAMEKRHFFFSQQSEAAVKEWVEAWGEDVNNLLKKEQEEYMKREEEEIQNTPEMAENCVRLIPKVKFYLLHLRSRDVEGFDKQFAPWNLTDIAAILADKLISRVERWGRDFESVCEECDKLETEISELKEQKLKDDLEDKEDEIMERYWKSLERRYRPINFIIEWNHPENTLNKFRRALDRGDIKDPINVNIIHDLEKEITMRNYTPFMKVRDF